jgi:hypothetical protein
MEKMLKVEGPRIRREFEKRVSSSSSPQEIMSAVFEVEGRLSGVVERMQRSEEKGVERELGKAFKGHYQSRIAVDFENKIVACALRLKGVYQLQIFNLTTLETLTSCNVVQCHTTSVGDLILMGNLVILHRLEEDFFGEGLDIWNWEKKEKNLTLDVYVRGSGNIKASAKHLAAIVRIGIKVWRLKPDGAFDPEPVFTFISGDGRPWQALYIDTEHVIGLKIDVEFDAYDADGERHQRNFSVHIFSLQDGAEIQMILGPRHPGIADQLPPIGLLLENLIHGNLKLVDLSDALLTSRPYELGFGNIWNIVGHGKKLVPIENLNVLAEIKEDKNGKKTATKFSLGKWCAKSLRLIETDDYSFVTLLKRDGRYILSYKDFL